MNRDRITTLFGFLVGVLLYLNDVGAKWPTTRGDWAHLVIAAIIAGLGYVGFKGKPVPVILLALMLSGCAVAAPYQGMDEKQIAAAVKDKNLTAWCSVINSPYGKGILQVLNLDKQVIPAGSSVKVDDACKVEITTGAKP